MRKLFIIFLFFIVYSCYPQAVQKFIYLAGGNYVTPFNSTYSYNFKSFLRNTSPLPAQDTIDIYKTAFDSLEYYHLDDSLSYLIVPVANTYNDATIDWIHPERTKATAGGNYYFGKAKGIYQWGNYSGAGYINTNYIPSGELNNASAGFYMMDDFVEQVIAGVVDGTSCSKFSIARNTASSVCQISLNSNTQSAYTFTGNAKLVAVNRESATKIRPYINGIKAASNITNNSTGIPTKSPYLIGYNLNDVVTGTYSFNRIGAYFYGKQLTDLQHTKLYEILTRFYASMGVGDYYYETANLYYKPCIYFNYPNFRLEHQRKNYIFGYRSDTLYFSVDSGATALHKLYFADDQKIDFSYLFQHGEILFGTTDNELYYSKDSLQTITQTYVQNMDGSPYVMHTPVNATYPGRYFFTLLTTDTMAIGTTEMLAWGNYGNSMFGACPINVYFTLNYGETIKTALQFGIDSAWRDNGASAPSNLAGNYLGDTLQPFKCRHVHGVKYNAIDTSLIVYTGDMFKGGVTNSPEERFWYKGKYVLSTDTWTWSISQRATVHPSFLSVGMNVKGDTTFWSGEGVFPAYYGAIWKCKTTELNDTTKFIRWKPFPGSLIRQYTLTNNEMMVSPDQKTIVYSKNDGLTWNTELLNKIPSSIPYTYDYLTGSVFPVDGWWFYKMNLCATVGSTPLVRIKLK